jgi:hypothetical protein
MHYVHGIILYSRVSNDNTRLLYQSNQNHVHQMNAQASMQYAASISERRC